MPGSAEMPDLSGPDDEVVGTLCSGTLTRLLPSVGSGRGALAKTSAPYRLSSLSPSARCLAFARGAFANVTSIRPSGSSSFFPSSSSFTVMI